MWVPWTGALVAGIVAGQASAISWGSEIWQNISMCNWVEARANIIRDTVYVDGGYLYWQPGLTNGELGTPEKDNNVNGTTYTLALGQPFNQSSNLTALFRQLPALGGMASNIAPNYVDGAMFATEDEMILYGGLFSNTIVSSPPPADLVLAYEPYPQDADSQLKHDIQTLPKGMTRYITNGAAVSSVSEKLGFYFSGVRAADWGPIATDGTATTLADTLITVNMSDISQGEWSNDTIRRIPARANAEIQWLPVADHGVLVAVGGVINPVELTTARGLNDSQIAASEKVSPTFMETVAVYDIASKTWYQQNTTGDIPPQLTLFCSVLATAKDRSSFNIYIYGGYNGLQSNSTPSDDVYILSVPQFVWTRAYTGHDSHGRSSHKCLSIYPDQMMVIGGIFQDNAYHCLDRIVEVFNLNTLSFQDSYDPRIWDDYRIPDVVTANIGGNENGSAEMMSPKSWGDPKLSSIFASEYTKTIPTYYPYRLQSPSTTASADPTAVPTVTIGSGGGGLPTWVAPVLGVVLGLIVVAAAAIIFLLWWRKRGSRNWGASDTQSSATGLKKVVFRWLNGTTSHEAKSSKAATELRGDDDGTTVVSSVPRERHISEVDSFDIHEMPDPIIIRPEMATDFNQSRDWTRSSWSHSELSPSVGSPSISELMGRDPLDSTLPTPASAVGPPSMRPTQSRIRRISHRSDDTSISELDASESARPSHSRQISDSSIPDDSSLSGTGDSSPIQAGFVGERRPQSPNTPRIETVHEVDESSSSSTGRDQGTGEHA